VAVLSHRSRKAQLGAASGHSVSSQITSAGMNSCAKEEIAAITYKLLLMQGLAGTYVRLKFYRSYFEQILPGRGRAPIRKPPIWKMNVQGIAHQAQPPHSQPMCQ
jgi:hypothetical protein